MNKKITLLCLIISLIISVKSKAQSYIAPQDTVKKNIGPNSSLTKYSTILQPLSADSRLLGCAIKAAAILKDTSAFDNKKGISLQRIFAESDLKYIASQGLGGAVALFQLINQNLPIGESIAFKTDSSEIIVKSSNPLLLKNLRAFINDKPALVTEIQWKENVYQAYIARSYGTKLFNTITIDAALTEIRKSPNLVLIDFDGKPITLATILLKEKNEFSAVSNFRDHTYPNARISEFNARENYRTAIFELMRLQESDINRHLESKELLADLTIDLKKGTESNVLSALKNSTFFDVNVPGNIGPVLLTEPEVINPQEISNKAELKALELLMLASLHYGEHDAVLLFRSLINRQGANNGTQTGLTTKRYNELKEHAIEQFKAIGFKNDKADNMTNADLVLVAVASPDISPTIKQNAYLGIIEHVGQSIINNYLTTSELITTKKLILFNPRISLNSRHTEYRTDYDPIDFVPESTNGQSTQKGSKITQDGVELRLESDIYFSNPDKINDKGVKPVIFPEFGVLIGVGNRKVGYDPSTTIGPLGPVPQFQSRYTNWGAHLGLDIGPFMIGADATILSTPFARTPETRFFDLSQGMTEYRYNLLTHIWYVKFKNDIRLTFDLDLVTETNNEGFGNLTSEQGTDAQIGSAKWQADYNLVHAGGVYNKQLAVNLLNEGFVKASYSAANSAALKVGLQKSSFTLSATAGLYNIQTRTGDKIYDNIFSNTLKGNVFVGIGLTYTFNSKIITHKHIHTEAYKGRDTEHKTENNSESQETKYLSLRSHYIFTSGQ